MYTGGGFGGCDFLLLDPTLTGRKNVLGEVFLVVQFLLDAWSILNGAPHFPTRDDTTTTWCPTARQEQMLWGVCGGDAIYQLRLISHFLLFGENQPFVRGP